MKALSVRQPWAWAIVNGHKDVENRVWKPPPYLIGARLVIHAGTHYVTEVDRAEADRLAGLTPDPTRYWQQRGYIGRVTLDGAHRARSCGGECSPWAHTQPEPTDAEPFGAADIWHWTLSHAVAFPTVIVAAGRLGLWDAPDGVEDGHHPGMRRVEADSA